MKTPNCFLVFLHDVQGDAPCKHRTTLFSSQTHWQFLWSLASLQVNKTSHDNVIAWKHFPDYWPFVQRNHMTSVDSHQKEEVMPSFHSFFVISLSKILNKQLNFRWLRCHDAQVISLRWVNKYDFNTCTYGSKHTSSFVKNSKAFNMINRWYFITDIFYLHELTQIGV